MCTHVKEGITKCVKCQEEEAVEKAAKEGENLDAHAEKNLLRNASNGVPWPVERFERRVVTARIKKTEVPAMLESLLPQTRLANGQAKLPNKGQPLAHYVALAQAEKHSAKEWLPDHADEWWDSVQGV